MPSDSSDSTNMTIQELLERFSSGSSRQKRRLIQLVEERSDDFVAMGSDLLQNFDDESDDWCAGWILQVCQRHQPLLISKLISSNSKGWFKTVSARSIDYSILQQSLLEERFEDADRITSALLRELAGDDAVERGYVYFSEVKSIPDADLVTLDRLWIAYSQGRFGFTVQARILDSLKGRYDMLWPKIGWKKDGVWTRYPKAFNWSISAPEGHMPLVNQLRGVRLMDELLNHPGLNSRRKIKP
ncbi:MULTISPECIES: GUN4 domain-containing protein [Prochlorococcus]|uniref:GUN4 domain-containing protein n=1 Tax=Prochlorococcus TaxID=1218 RepID=UPI0005339DE5|nr:MULTISPECIES: GUN4 domain-containing protein [Prochlorococcus]KGG12617.1 hypothetical protein EV05_1829 [Prochlorococcus sp. MIT 0601]